MAKTKKEIQKDYLKRSGYAPINSYNKKAYDDIKVRVKKGEREKIKAHAEGLGKSLNSYIYDLIKSDMND